MGSRDGNPPVDDEDVELYRALVQEFHGKARSLQNHRRRRELGCGAAKARQLRVTRTIYVADRSVRCPVLAGGRAQFRVSRSRRRVPPARRGDRRDEIRPSRDSPLLAPSPGRCSLNCHPLGAATVGLLGWTRFHVGHGGPRLRLAYTALPSHAFRAASRKHRRLAAAASSRNPYLYWECEENRHKGVHFAQQRVNGSGVVGYRSGQTQVLPAGRYAASRDQRRVDGRVST